MNPMFMNLFSSRLGPLRQMMGAVKAAQNPMAALQQMAGQNPQLQQALQLVQQSGGIRRRHCRSFARSAELTRSRSYPCLMGISDR